MVDTNALIDRAVARSEALAELVVGNGVLARAGEVLQRHFNDSDGAVVVVADENTFGAAGAPLMAALESAGVPARTIVLPATPRPKASVELGDDLATRLGEAIPVALGSGVINDVTKYAAFQRNRRYVCVPTAASMDGYASAGAPLSKNGFKSTLPTRTPVAILADLDVVAAAPARLSGWGYGDTAGKVPAGGDWLIADALGIELIDDVAWPLIQGNVKAWLANPAGVKAGDPAAIADLFAGLTLSGLGMEFYGSSRPASGADHQIAHMWEMEGHEFLGERVSHGACVSVGCVTALRLMDFMLRQDLSALDIERVVARAPSLDDKRREITSLMDEAVAERAADETAAKHLDTTAHRDRLRKITGAWPTLKPRFREHVLRAPQVAAMLTAAGAPTESEDIGIDRARLRRTVLAARFIRSRYTVLDFLEECGLLAAALDAVIPLTQDA